MSLATVQENSFGLIESFELSSGIQGIRFKHKHCCGEISLYGGQVLGWQPTGHKPIFWLSRAAEYKEGFAIRGGIPLCWPWFGGEVKDTNQALIPVSNHGFARQSQWQLSRTEINDDNITIELTLKGHNNSNYWPAKFTLTQTLIFSDTFEQRLEIQNLSQQSVEYTGALHSYFCVGDPAEVKIKTLNNVSYDDKLTGIVGKFSELVNCKGPIDRVYHSAVQQSICDNKWQRKITVSSTNCHQWVLWNPGVDANKMADMHQMAENEFVCLEAANTQWQIINANSSHTMSQKISVSKF